MDFSQAIGSNVAELIGEKYASYIDGCSVSIDLQPAVADTTAPHTPATLRT